VVRKRDSEREQIRSLQLALKDAESKGQTQVQRPTVLQQEVLETKKIFKKKRSAEWVKKNRKSI
jgi:hypothetical protein